MPARRATAAILAAIVFVAIVGVSLTLKGSLSALSSLGDGLAISKPAPTLLSEAAIDRSDEASGSSDDLSAPQKAFSVRIGEARDCLDERDFECMAQVLNELRARTDVTASEMAEILYFESALHYAQGRREEAIRILRDEIPGVSGLSDDALGWTSGMLASVYFQMGRDEEALEAVGQALRLTSQEWLYPLREQIVASLYGDSRRRRPVPEGSREPRDPAGSPHGDPRGLILLDEVIE